MVGTLLQLKKIIPKASHDNVGEAESENNDGESEVVLDTLSLLKHSQ